MEKFKLHKAQSKVISPNAIIYSIERDINDLQSEVSVRSQKDKLSSIKDSLKILLKAITSSQEKPQAKEVIEESKEAQEKPKTKKEEAKTFSASKSISFQEENSTEVDCIKEKPLPIRRTFHTSNTVIPKKNEPVKLLEPVPQIVISSPEVIEEPKDQSKQLLKRINDLEEEVQELNETLTVTKEEFNKTSLEFNEMLLARQNALKTLNEEYDSLCSQLSKSQEDNAKCLQQNIALKRAYCELKGKVDALMQANAKFTNGLMLNEQDQRQLNEQLRVANSRIAKMKASREKLESTNANLLNELESKDQRLNAVRKMNEILENKSQRIIGKLKDYFGDTHPNSIGIDSFLANEEHPNQSKPKIIK